MPQQQQAKMFDGLPAQNASMLQNCMRIIHRYPQDKALTDGEREEFLVCLRDAIIRGRYRDPDNSQYIRLKDADCHKGMRAIDCFVIYEQEATATQRSRECRLPLTFFLELHHFMYLDGASL